MAAPSARMWVSVDDKAALVKISGRANFTSGFDLKTLLSELLQKGYVCFVLDLAECTLMDSTFLGVLAGFGVRLNGPQPDQLERRLELCSPNARILDLLENLGVLHLFKIISCPAPLPEAAQPLAPDAPQPSHQEITQTCLDAHRTLMEIHPDNVRRFKEVTQFLAEDLKKLKAAS